MDYRRNQQFPMTSQGEDGKIVSINDSTLPQAQLNLVNNDYVKKATTSVIPINGQSIFGSEDNINIKFPIVSSADDVVSWPESYIDFELELVDSTGKHKLGYDYAEEKAGVMTEKSDITPDMLSEIATINTINFDNRKDFVKNGTTVKYVYTANSNCLFDEMKVKDFGSDVDFATVKNPGLLTKVILNGATNDFFEDDNIDVCDSYMANCYKTMPDWFLRKRIGDTDTVVQQNAYKNDTPRGFAPMMKGTSKDTKIGTLCDRGVVEQGKDNTIPYCEIFNQVLATGATKNSTTAVSAFGSEAKDDGLQFIGGNADANVSQNAKLTMSTTILNQIAQTVNATTPASIPFPQVRRLLHNIATGQRFRVFPVVDIMQSCVKMSPTYNKMNIELVLNKYANAFTDCVHTAGVVGDVVTWTPTSSFAKFNIKNPILHLTKYQMKPETSAQLATQVQMSGYSYPFTQFKHEVSSWQNKQQELSKTFHDPSVRSLEKIIIIPRYEKNVSSNVTNNKFVFTSGCAPDCDEALIRPYDGIYSIRLEYRGQQFPLDGPILFEPYKFDHIKKYAMEIFESPFGILLPALYRDNYEGITACNQVKKYVIQKDATTLTDPEEKFSYEKECFSQQPYVKTYCAPSQNGFFIALDMRCIRGAINSVNGLDLTAADLTITLRRKTVNEFTPDIHLDFYLCEAAQMNITKDLCQVIY